MESIFQGSPFMKEFVKRVDWVIENVMNSIADQIRRNEIERQSEILAAIIEKWEPIWLVSWMFVNFNLL